MLLRAGLRCTTGGYACCPCEGGCGDGMGRGRDNIGVDVFAVYPEPIVSPLRVVHWPLQDLHAHGARSWHIRAVEPNLHVECLTAMTLTDRLVSQTHAIMIAWEMGETEVYRAACAPGVRMTIPAYGLDVVGFDAIWGVRVAMKPLADGPLDLHTVTTAVVDGHGVRARSHVISRLTGQFTQHAEVVFDFDAQGALVAYHQDVVWMARS